MKIAVWHNLPSGGGKRALYYHVRGLVERGHEVECWSLDNADLSYLPLTEFATEHVVPFNLNSDSPDPLVEEWALGYYKEVERMKAFDEACKQSVQEIESGNFDVLFVNSSLPYHMPYVMRHVRMPNVLYLQEPCRQLYEAAQVLPWVASACENLSEATLLEPHDLIDQYPRLQALRVQAKQEWLNAQACDTILVNSYFSRESVLRAYGVDSKVCYLGVDTTLFRNLGLKREPFVVGLGACNSTKGIDLAVKAVSLLDPRPPLIWISNSVDEGYQGEVSELAKSLGVDLQIRKRISDLELVETLNKATLLLYTSRLEPFGFAPLEANACGLPVVGVAEGGVRETINDGLNGFLVDPDPRSIARATERLLRNPALAREMGESAALHVQQSWTVEGSVDRLETFLVQAISPSSQEKNYRQESSAYSTPKPQALLVETSTEDLETRNQLDAILNTRAWRWAQRYGRFKYAFLLPAYNFFGRFFGKRPSRQTSEETVPLS